MDGAHTVSSGFAGTESWHRRGSCGVDVGAGPRVLLGYMSAWGDAGLHILDKWPTQKKKYRFSYSPAKNWLRYGVLVAFIIAMIAGVGSVVALLAPYSSYGRIVWNLLGPVYDWGNNLLAGVAEHYDSYAVYEKEVWIRSIPTFVLAAVTFVALAILAWRNGRTYCNTICPVGTVLGALSRVSLLGIRIEKDKCVECGLCSRKCKSSCIDGKSHRVDYSRCVACMDCIDTCTHNAISYGWRWSQGKDIDSKKSGKKVDESRRAFISAGAAVVATGAIEAQSKRWTEVWL